MNQQSTHGVSSDEWESSLCNCAPCGTCLLSSFCPCILIGRTASRLKDPSMKSHSAFNGNCGLFCCIQTFTCFGFLHNTVKRTEIREKYGIKGSGCGDCCVSFWCLCCSMIQQDNEVKLRSSHAPITEGYQAQKEGMHVPINPHDAIPQDVPPVPAVKA